MACQFCKYCQCQYEGYPRSHSTSLAPEFAPGSDFNPGDSILMNLASKTGERVQAGLMPLRASLERERSSGERLPDGGVRFVL